jgi:hypothetical protein
MRTGFFVSHKSLLSPDTKEEWAKGYRGLTEFRSQNSEAEGGGNVRRGLESAIWNVVWGG